MYEFVRILTLVVSLRYILLLLTFCILLIHDEIRKYRDLQLYINDQIWINYDVSLYIFLIEFINKYSTYRNLLSF